MKYAIVVPTYNPGKEWLLWVEAVKQQSLQPDAVIIIDSSSKDGFVGSFEPAHWHIIVINAIDFDHGGTRNKGFEFAQQFNVDFVVTLTQDSILDSPQSIEKLLTPFSEPQVAAVCGRQLPRKDANVRSRFARLFNYRSVSFENSKADISIRGIKTAFMSNSFAAYRLKAFNEIGKFPEKIIFGEDMYISAKLILADWKTFFCSEACSIHSHNYSLLEDFKRYFDIGVFHQQTPFLYENFGGASSEGFKFLMEELKYVAANNILSLPMVFFEIFVKFIGHKAGLNFRMFPNALRRRMSLNKKFWK